MTAIPGVSIKTDSNGDLTHVIIDVRQHQGAIPLLESAGLLPLTSFEDDCKNALTHEQALESTLAFVRNLCKK